MWGYTDMHIVSNYDHSQKVVKYERFMENECVWHQLNVCLLGTRTISQILLRKFSLNRHIQDTYLFCYLTVRPSQPLDMTWVYTVQSLVHYYRFDMMFHWKTAYVGNRCSHSSCKTTLVNPDLAMYTFLVKLAPNPGLETVYSACLNYIMNIYSNA